MCSVKETGASGPTRDVFVKPSGLRGPSGRAGRKPVSQTQQDHAVWGLSTEGQVNTTRTKGDLQGRAGGTSTDSTALWRGPR